MSQKKLDVMNDMTADIVKNAQDMLNRYIEQHGAEFAMQAFSSALAIAAGAMLSTACLGLADAKQRNPFMNKFFILARESAELHNANAMKGQH